MRLLLTVWSFCLSLAFAMFPPEEGMDGFPSNAYLPYCATACLRSFYTLTLSCSSKGITIGSLTFVTSTQCFANNTPYLTSVAWCANKACAAYNASTSLMEYFWEEQITGQKAAGAVTVPPKWSYAQALEQVQTPPTLQLLPTDTELNTTALAPPRTYISQYNILYSVQREGTVENTYGIVILAAGFGLPILLTWLGFVPCVSSMVHKFRPYLVWPSIIGSFHSRPLPYLIGNAPTVGQALYIMVFVILNIVLTAVGYQSPQPNAWYGGSYEETMASALSRTGKLAYVMASLLFLFAGRNNVLLWMTNWSHGTYLLLHRWIARVFAIQSILHSILALVLYCKDGSYAAEHNKPYWIWGIVATILVVVLTFGSGLYVRRYFYQSFLNVHIILSAMVVVSCWYHYYDLYAYLGGVLDWIYAACAVWAFDRGARFVRILIVGSRRSNVTELGNSYVRIDVPAVRWGLEPGKHAYLYFPALRPWQPWENHPFSVLPTALLSSAMYQDKSEAAPQLSQRRDSTEHAETDSDMEKNKSQTKIASQPPRSHVGLTLFVRKGKGMTRAFQSHASLLTLVEGPYHNNSTSAVLRCDRLLLIGGGVGITALVPFVANHWNVKLCWSVKESARCLVHEMEGVLGRLAEKQVLVGERLQINEILAQEGHAGWETVGVVVAGPGEMCDDVRMHVTVLAKEVRTVFELEVEDYSW